MKTSPYSPASTTDTAYSSSSEVHTDNSNNSNNSNIIKAYQAQLQNKYKKSYQLCSSFNKSTKMPHDLDFSRTPTEVGSLSDSLLESDDEFDSGKSLFFPRAKSLNVDGKNYYNNQEHSEHARPEFYHLPELNCTIPSDSTLKANSIPNNDNSKPTPRAINLTPVHNPINGTNPTISSFSLSHPKDKGVQQCAMIRATSEYTPVTNPNKIHPLIAAFNPHSPWIEALEIPIRSTSLPTIDNGNSSSNYRSVSANAKSANNIAKLSVEYQCPLSPLKPLPPTHFQKMRSNSACFSELMQNDPIFSHSVQSSSSNKNSPKQSLSKYTDKKYNFDQGWKEVPLHLYTAIVVLLTLLVVVFIETNITASSDSRYHIMDDNNSALLYKKYSNNECTSLFTIFTSMLEKITHFLLY